MKNVTGVDAAGRSARAWVVLKSKSLLRSSLRCFAFLLYLLVF